MTDVWAYGDYAYLGTFDEGAYSLDDTGVHSVDITKGVQCPSAGL